MFLNNIKIANNLYNWEMPGQALDRPARSSPRTHLNAVSRISRQIPTFQFQSPNQIQPIDISEVHVFRRLLDQIMGKIFGREHFAIAEKSRNLSNSKFPYDWPDPNFRVSRSGDRRI